MAWFNPFEGGGAGGGTGDAYTKAETNQLLNQKVDKVNGKGLSTEDYTTEDKTKVDNLGTAAEHDVPASGDASNNEVVLGNDTRLTDARPASDVSSWAKELTKPSYSYSEIINTPTVDAAPASGSNNLVSSDGVYTALSDKVDASAIGTAAAKDVPSSGNAANDECVLGSDTRLSDARPASDVNSWAKAENKPSYSYSEITGTPTLGTAAAKDVPTSGNASATQVVLGNDGRLAWMDTNGDIYFGATRIARVMDEGSYTDLVSKEKIFYLTYPTPTNGSLLSVNLQNSGIDNMRGESEEENEEINELEEPIEEEPIEELPETPPDDDMR